MVAADIVKLLTEGVQATVIFSSREMHIGFINKAMLELWNRKSIILGSRLAVEAPEFDKFIPILQEVWDTGTAFVAAEVFADINHDGKLIPTPFDIEYRPILDVTGNTIAIINSAMPVNERMEKSEALRDKAVEERLLNVSLEDKNEQLNAVNQQLEALNKEYVATNEELKKLNEQLAALNEEYNASNEELHLTLEEVAVLNERYNISNLVLQELNEDLNRNRTQLTNALRAASLGSYDLDIASGLMECSDQCKLNFGRPPEQRFDFSDLQQCILAEYRDIFYEKVQQAISEKSSFNIEYQIQWPDGALHWIQANGTPQFDSSGTAVQIIGVTKLITEKKNYQAKKDEFLSVASHELKTPITVLKANLQLLDRLKSKIENTTAVSLIDSCNRSMDKINVMLVELLDVSKYADGKIELNLSTFNVNDFLQNSVLHLPFEELHKVELNSLKLEITADENRLEQVMINFINNAIKYAASSEKIIISATEHENRVKFSVQDFGDGIEVEDSKMLFDRYWQGDKKGKNSDGLGLGLYICAEIVSKHKGTIGVDSIPGSGSLFWFEVPKSQH